MTISLNDRPPTALPARLVDGMLRATATFYLSQAALFGVLVYVAYLAIVMVVGIMQPQIDWDVLAYVALAGERIHTDPVALHAYAYGVLQASVTPAEFTLLTDDGGYRSQMFADAAGFVSMLGMYRVKWLYVEIVTFLSQFTGPIEAIRLVSMASALAFAGVAFAWLYAERSLTLAAAFVGVLIVSGFADMARAVSPDMLFSALLLGALLAHRFGRESWTALLLVLGFLVRPDNLIFLGVFAGLLAIYRQRSWGVYAAFVMCALAFVPLTTMTGQPGWWKQLYFASVEKAPTLVGFDPPFSIIQYLYALVKQFLLAVTAQSWVGTLLLGMCAWAATGIMGRPLDKQRRMLVLALVFGVGAKFILVPIFDTRIYFAYLVAIFLAVSGNLLPLERSGGRQVSMRPAPGPL